MAASNGARLAEVVALTDGATLEAEALARVGAVPATAEDVEKQLDLCHRLRELGGASRYLQGALLRGLKKDDAWKKAAQGDETFWEWCERRVGMKHRGVLQIIKMDEQAERLGLDYVRLKGIGWTKGRLILGVATLETLETWIARAQRLTLAELEALVRAEKDKPDESGGGDTDPDRRDAFETLSVRVTREERMNIESAIEEAARLAPKVGNQPASRGTALDLVCVEWRANRIETRERTLAWHVAHLERAYGARITVGTVEAEEEDARPAAE